MPDLTVVAFDPGQTTGWATMTVAPECLTGQCGMSRPNSEGWGIQDCVLFSGWKWGQIDAAALGSSRSGDTAHLGHDALNFVGENLAVDFMLDLTVNEYPSAAVALEKFVLDPKAASGKFDLLSPVRIISAYSHGLHSEAMDTAGMARRLSRGEFVTRDPYTRFYLVNRGDPKRTCTDERMKRWGFSSVVFHKNRHACDASRIAFYFLRDCVGQSFKAKELRWRAWPHIFTDPAIEEIKRAYPTKKKQQKGERI